MRKLHPPDKIPAPSPKDVYHLIQGNKDNPNYTLDIVLGADGSQYAIVITDRVKALAFLNKYPSVTNLDGNGWAGDVTKKGSPGYFFSAYIAVLINEGYSATDAQIFAMVYMMEDVEYDMGIKLMKKDNGTFKQLDTNPYKDSAGKNHYGVKISN